MKLTEEIIKGMNLEQYSQNREAIKSFYAPIIKKEQKIQREVDKKVEEKEFLLTINEIYWKNRKINPKCFKSPWLKHASNAKYRCNNPNDSKFKYYGGRGIKYLLTSDEIKRLWIRDKAYLMKQPSIDRKDNNGDYIYKNCRFIELVKNISKGKK